MDEREVQREAEREQEPREEKKRVEDLQPDEGRAADVQAGSAFEKSATRFDPYKN